MKRISLALLSTLMLASVVEVEARHYNRGASDCPSCRTCNRGSCGTRDCGVRCDASCGEAGCPVTGRTRRGEDFYVTKQVEVTEARPARKGSARAVVVSDEAEVMDADVEAPRATAGRERRATRRRTAAVVAR